MQQHEREMLVGAVLDISVGQWQTWLDTADPLNTPEPIQQRVADLITGLREHNQDRYLQSLVRLTDAGLLWVVDHVGNNPGVVHPAARLAEAWEQAAEAQPEQDPTTYDPAGELGEAVAEAYRECAQAARELAEPA